MREFETMVEYHRHLFHCVLRKAWNMRHTHKAEAKLLIKRARTLRLLAS